MMKRGQNGFTLIEILIVLAITSVIVGPLAMATTTLLTNPPRSADQNVVLSQVQNAGYWISRDVQMASNVTPSGPTGFPLSLSIPVDSDKNHDLRVNYLYDGNKLKREVRDSSLTLISETLIADYIDTANTEFIDLASGRYKLTVRASRGQAALTRSYEIKQRVSRF